MSCGTDLIECDTVQIIEPRDDLLVDTAGTRSDVDERGEVELTDGQTSAVIIFQVPKLNAYYNFEYLYIDAMGNVAPGGIHVIPTVRAIEGFAVLFAGAPIGSGYVLHWRVTIVRTSSLIQVDAPEDLYLQLPVNQNAMAVTFVNPRSNVNYGFTELRVENLHDGPTQTPIHVQVYTKTISGFLLAINPRPRTIYYFLRVRTP